jgi:hypothetical protein
MGRLWKDLEKARCYVCMRVFRKSRLRKDFEGHDVCPSCQDERPSRQASPGRRTIEVGWRER